MVPPMENVSSSGWAKTAAMEGIEKSYQLSVAACGRDAIRYPLSDTGRAVLARRSFAGSEASGGASHQVQ
jgi:hypothetical protein